MNALHRPVAVIERILFHGSPVYFCLLWVVVGVGVAALLVVWLPGFGPGSFAAWSVGSLGLMYWLEVRFVYA
jgi:hypothetical protein